MKNKSGLSPVIATVLLILLAIAIAGIVLSWAFQFMGDRTETDKQLADEICKFILYDIEGEIENNILDLWIVNNGNNNISGMDVKFVYDEGSVIKRFDVNVPTSDANNISIDITNNVTKLLLYPVVSGTLTGKSTEKLVRCESLEKIFEINISDEIPKKPISPPITPPADNSDFISIKTCQELQNIQNNLGEDYKLMKNIDCSETKSWNNKAGFVPIGNSSFSFSGSLDGQGFDISGLYINRSEQEFIGLFGYTNVTFKITNVNLIDISISGKNFVGGIVGANQGAITNSSSSGNVTGSSGVGDLVGYNMGTISNAYSSGNVNGYSSVGGLVGYNWRTITNSYSTGSVNGTEHVGGLVGHHRGAITNSSSSGNVNGYSSVGGLVGYNWRTITNSYSTGSVNGTEHVGGLVGYNNETITNSSSSGNVTGSNKVGGLVGDNYDGVITNSSSSGNVTGSSSVGGLVGYNWRIIINSSSSGNVNGSFYVGGLVGYNNETINNSYSSGNVTGSSDVGGIAGANAGKINNSYSSGSVNGSLNIGGLIGWNHGTITSSYSIGNIFGYEYVGGFIGSNHETITNSYWDREVSNRNNMCGYDKGGKCDNGYGKTTSEMKEQSTFKDWDFTNIWNISSSKNNGYPYLKWQGL